MIEQVPIKNLKLLDRNPRRINKEQFEKLVKSLKADPEFLQCRPVLVNRTQEGLIVYAGNQRVRAAKKLGWKMIACEIENDLPEELMKSRCLKDNVTMGEFDFDMLTSDFDVDILFDAGFTEKLLAGSFEEVSESMAETVKNLGITEPSDEIPEKKKKSCPNCGHLF